MNEGDNNVVLLLRLTIDFFHVIVEFENHYSYLSLWPIEFRTGDDDLRRRSIDGVAPLQAVQLANKRRLPLNVPLLLLELELLDVLIQGICAVATATATP